MGAIYSPEVNAKLLVEWCSKGMNTIITLNETKTIISTIFNERFYYNNNNKND